MHQFETSFWVWLTHLCGWRLKGGVEECDTSLRYILGVEGCDIYIRYMQYIMQVVWKDAIFVNPKNNIFLLFLWSLTGLYFKYILCFERLTFSEVGGWVTPNIRDPMNTCLSFQQTCFDRISYAQDQKKYCRFSLNPPTHLWKRLSIRL